MKDYRGKKKEKNIVKNERMILIILIISTSLLNLLKSFDEI